jgi:hypothetical protein
VVNAVKLYILQAGYSSVEMGEDLRDCLPCPMGFTWVIGAVDAVFDAFFSRATAETACFTTCVYVV